MLYLQLLNRSIRFLIVITLKLIRLGVIPCWDIWTTFLFRLYISPESSSKNYEPAFFRSKQVLVVEESIFTKCLMWANMLTGRYSTSPRSRLPSRDLLPTAVSPNQFLSLPFLLKWIHGFFEQVMKFLWSSALHKFSSLD